MHTLFQDIGMHTGLGRVIEQIGGNRFQKQLVLLLRQHLLFDNALAIFYPANDVSVALEEYDAEPHAGPTSMLVYLNRLYLLDPLYQAYRGDLASGLYRLEETAPDHFRQSEYYLSYFHDNILEDEVQFILQVPGQGAPSLSSGMQRMFADEECGMLGLLSSWVLALMRWHWQQRSQRLLPVTPQEEMATQMHDALSHFSASVLSERELEIACLILCGYSSRAVAERLTVSPETIKVYRRYLYAKLDTSSQSELFSLFIQPPGYDPENP